MDGKIGLRIVSALVLIAAIVGIGVFAFNAGVAQGVAAKLPAATSGNVPYPYYGMPFVWHPFWGFGFFGLLIALFLLFVALPRAALPFLGTTLGIRRPNAPESLAQRLGRERRAPDVPGNA